MQCTCERDEPRLELAKDKPARAGSDPEVPVPSTAKELRHPDDFSRRSRPLIDAPPRPPSWLVAVDTCIVTVEEKKQKKKQEEQQELQEEQQEQQVGCRNVARGKTKRLKRSNIEAQTDSGSISCFPPQSEPPSGQKPTECEQNPVGGLTETSRLSPASTSSPFQGPVGHIWPD